MSFVNDFNKKLKQNIIAISAIVLTILLALFNQKMGSEKVVLFWAILILAGVLIIILIGRFFKWKERRSWVIFCRNRDDIPPQYRIEETLKYLTKTAGTLEILGRTAYSWLCGDEDKFHKEGFKEEKTKYHDLISNAINAGSSIRFVIQNPHINLPHFTLEQNKNLHDHSMASIESFEEIYENLSQTHRNRLKLFFTDEIIENSMTRLKENNEVTRLIFDLSTRFKAEISSSENFSKPVLIFTSHKPEIDEYLKEFDDILDKSIKKEEFESTRGENLQEINSLINEFSCYSSLRKDDSKKLAKIAAKSFIAKNDPKTRGIPPVSIQFLVTNKCTTSCKMCDHYKLSKKENGNLTLDDIKRIFKSINDIGTKSVIISGGEPLAHNDIFKFLNIGKEIGLDLGLLTNGVKWDEKPISLEESKIIAKTCSWVQLSIDSFEQETYKKIRNKDYFGITSDSLNNLLKSNLTNVEVCYTIQKDNIEEIINGIQNIDNIIPPSVPLRFKFAHGPDKENNFLCTERQLMQAVNYMARHYPRSNSEYLARMIEKGYFDYKCLSTGTPLQNKMALYNQSGYICHALEITCLIDSNGDVYPCCFLFDDNNAQSSIRDKYKIGSLRSKNTGRILENGDELIKVWFDNDYLQLLRETTLPVDKTACSYCTRHFYQNDYLNKLYNVFSKGRRYGVAEQILEDLSGQQIDSFWV